MFKAARLKLTILYLIIITIICILFSLFTYRLLTNEVDRFARFQRNRIEQRIRFDNGAISPDFDLIKDTKERIAFGLVLVNGMIIIVSGGLAYFLAGKTLKPIQNMLDDQSRFVADSSHELRTPITSLKLATEVALRDKNLSLLDTKQILNENLLDIDKLQRLSDSLLRIAQYDIPGKETKHSRVSTNSIASVAVAETQTLAKDRNITIKNNTKNFYVLGDQSELTSLLVILLDNAIKYSQKDTNIVLASKKVGRNIYLSISDQGDGISGADLPHIFERFYRSDKSRTGAKGFGLGLSIAKRIIDSHGGTMKIDSKINCGTTVELKLNPYSKT
jgi:signal transduction histidine kinase